MRSLVERVLGAVQSPYSRFRRSDLILRDELALERTMLAIERTFLAYARSAVALVLAGVTFLHFSDALWFSVIGFVCIILGAAIAPIAVVRYGALRKALGTLRGDQTTGHDAQRRDEKP